MKISAHAKLGLLLPLAAAFIASGASAEPKAESRTVSQNEEETVVYLTGSNIPQRVKRKSIGTNSAQNIRIFTKSELETTGHFSPFGLALDPSVQITHGGRR